MADKNKKQQLIESNFCREYLYFSGLLSESENEKVHKRIMKFKDKYRIDVTREELNSIDFKR